MKNPLPALLLPLLAAIALPGAAQPDPDLLPALTVEQLKAAYLACDRIATRQVLDPGTAGACSSVAEALMQRHFGGDFDRLLAWWRAERAP